MCTPSRMPFAAIVRLTCSVISSAEGIWVNASALAESRSRSRCSASRKILPVVEPEALPDRVTALDGRVERADRSPVAVGELAVHADDEVAVPLVVTLPHHYLPGW